MTEPFSGPLRPYYEQGQLAGQRGEPKDACRFRRADRRCAWLRGWYAGDDLRLQLEAWRERRHAPRKGAIHLPAGRVGA
jgi:ribosome modulation factor